MRFLDPCKKKGHDWQLYGWSVMGFGITRYHHVCSRCKSTTVFEASELDKEDEPEPEQD